MDEREPNAQPGDEKADPEADQRANDDADLEESEGVDESAVEHARDELKRVREAE